MGHERYTVAEHPYYFRKAQKLLTEEQMKEIVDIVSREPEVGEVMARVRAAFASFAMPGTKAGARAEGSGSSIWRPLKKALSTWSIFLARMKRRT